MPTISIDTNDHHFMGSAWLNPTTPTTDQLLKGDNSNTIISTFASLGLDDSPSTIHTSHSYSSLNTLSENQQWYPDSLNRPRAQSSVDNQQQQQSLVSHPTTIWNKPSFTRPYLRNSNSSADLLEMMARQRRTTTTTSSHIEDTDHWAGVKKKKQLYISPSYVNFFLFSSFFNNNLLIGFRFS